MADKNIGALPQAAQLDDSSLLVAEQQGQAVKITGAQFKEFGRQAVVGQVQSYVDQAEAAADRAEGAVRSVEDMTVDAAALPAGQEATVTKTIRAGTVHLAFGLPRGEQGVPGPEGKQGQRGPKGDPGTGLKILGYYDTLPALEAAAASPSAGDAYGIGTEPPYSIYVFDGTSHTWKDNGQLSGGGGGILPENVVTAEGGASIEVPTSLGEGPHTITFVDEEEPALTAEDIEYTGGQSVKEAMDGLFTSVSDGKAAIASAITDKGVPTAQDADFSTLADHIRNIASGAETSDATATPGDILSPKTAYTAAGKVEGLIPSLAARTIMPGTADQTIASGQYLRGTQTIRGDTNLTSGNIKKGVTLFGVTGALESSFQATLTVKADIGAVVTAKNGDTEVSALSTTGTVVLELPIEGTWKVTAVRGVAQYNTVTLQVSSQYSAQLTAEVHIVRHGAITGLGMRSYEIAAAKVGETAIFLGGRGGYSASSSETAASQVTAYDKNYVINRLQSLDGIRKVSITGGTTIGEYALFPNKTYLITYNVELVRGSSSSLSVSMDSASCASTENYSLFVSNNVVNAYDKTLTRTIPDPLAYAYGGTTTISSKENALFCSSAGGVTAYNKYLTRTVPTKLSAGRNYLSGAMAGNYSLFAGGFDRNGVSAVVEVYDLFLTKATSQNLNVPRGDMGATTLHDHAIFAGGRTKSSTLDNTDSNVYRDDVEIYDPYLVLLRPEEGLGEARDSLSAVAIGDSAIFAGGTTGWTSNQLYLCSSSYAEAYEYV